MFDTGIIVPLAFFATIAFILVGLTKVISDGRTRRKLIESGATAEVARAIATGSGDDPGLFSALRWGFVTGGMGLALILVQFLPFRPDDPIVLGLILLFTAAGLLAYFASARRLVRQAEQGSSI